mmetsp:Transcript_30454/g.86885  ORF Transcript_30454/g.86885 Transcript_30454/m.86885 type:complete len:304 (+) Transcript_30454:405-1316(+)
MVAQDVLPVRLGRERLGQFALPDGRGGRHDRRGGGGPHLELHQGLGKRGGGWREGLRDRPHRALPGDVQPPSRDPRCGQDRRPAPGAARARDLGGGAAARPRPGLRRQQHGERVPGPLLQHGRAARRGLHRALHRRDAHGQEHRRHDRARLRPQPGSWRTPRRHDYRGEDVADVPGQVPEEGGRHRQVRPLAEEVGEGGQQREARLEREQGGAVHSAVPFRRHRLLAADVAREIGGVVRRDLLGLREAHRGRPRRRERLPRRPRRRGDDRRWLARPQGAGPRQRVLGGAAPRGLPGVGAEPAR